MNNPIVAINWNEIEDDIDNDVWKRLTSFFWLPEKIALSNDISSWNTLTEDEQDVVMKVFANLTVLDTLQGTVGAPTMMQHSRTKHEEAVFSYITFNEAFAGGTQLLTDSGWKNIEDITEDDLVAQYDPEENLTSFAHPEVVEPHFSPEVYEIASGNGSARQVVSGGHRVYIEEKVKKENSCKEWKPAVYEARELKGVSMSAHRRFRSVAPAAEGTGMTDADRLLLAINADGAFSGERYTGEKTGTVPARFSLAKPRKIDRFLGLASSLGWRVRETTPTGEKRNFYLDVPLEFVQEGRKKELSKWWDLSEKSSTWCQEFIEESGLWDGHLLKGDGGVMFSTTSKEDSDFYVGVASLAGYRSRTKQVVDERSDSFSDVYTTNVTWNKDTVDSQSVSISQVEPQMVYCVKVPTTFLVTRNGSGPVISGNCVHAKSYSSIFTTLSNTEKIDNIFRWSTEDPRVQYKAQRVNEFYEKAENDPLMAKAASVLLESFLFYAGFYVAFQWAANGKLTNTADIIRLILRDEGIHGYYIGYKYQLGRAELSLAEQKELDKAVFDLADDLLYNEIKFTEDVYDKIGWTEDVKTYIRYNFNKALNNLGYDGRFEGEDVDVKPSILVQMAADIQDNQDFFSGSGSTYVVGVAEETTDDDWD